MYFSQVGSVGIGTTTITDPIGIGGKVVESIGPFYTRDSVTQANYASYGINAGTLYADDSANMSMVVGGGGTDVRLHCYSGTQLYYCSGGTLSQIVIRGSSGAEATACTTGGGTVTGLGIYVP